MREVHYIPILDKRLVFPNPENVRRDGFVAIGGDLSPDRLMLAYRMGIFPWSADPITWWSPHPRGILPLEKFHVPRRLAQIIRQGKFEIRFDTAFRKVIEGCAQVPRRDEKTWISPEFIEAYTKLHKLGHAHSIECWMDGKLAGGLYGVALKGLFAGESMFHVKPNASNIALFFLVEHLKQKKITLFDIQMLTPHTRRLGAINISRKKYIELLHSALEQNCAF